jgi:uncharacterized protein YcbK (DUF882 family)
MSRLDENAAAIQSVWKVSGETASRGALLLESLHAATGQRWQIISGFRTAGEQVRLSREGRPTAPVDLSNHTSCPATALDFRGPGIPTRAVKATFGRLALEAGFRWGGGSAVDDVGIPSDWNHVDLGPRRP